MIDLSFLDKITGPIVKFTGVGLAAVLASIFLRGGHRIGALAPLSIVLLTQFYPKLFKFLNGFADVPEWPNFVALGVSALFTAHSGGIHAVYVLAGLLIAMDGNVFDALY